MSIVVSHCLRLRHHLINIIITFVVNFITRETKNKTKQKEVSHNSCKIAKRIFKEEERKAQHELFCAFTPRT